VWTISYSIIAFIGYMEHEQSRMRPILSERV
jgi:hypothetical protein